MAESEHHGDIAGEAGETFRHAAGSLTKGRDSLVFATVLIVLLSSAFMVAVTYMSWQALIERETSERISSEQIAFFLQNMQNETHSSLRSNLEGQRQSCERLLSLHAEQAQRTMEQMAARHSRQIEIFAELTAASQEALVEDNKRAGEAAVDLIEGQAE